MPHWIARTRTSLALLAGFTSVLGAQAGGPPRHRPLREYQGVYAYHGNSSLTIVAGDTMLYALLDEAKYPLRVLDDDRFLNNGGDTIPFRRSGDGVVTGLTERGVFFARRTATIDTTLVRLTLAPPRAPGANGRVAPYAYARPAQLADGIRVGDAGQAGFDTSLVTRLMNRVIDRTYPDVHSILVYRHGALVIEEYFYGYDRQRPHQMRSATKSIVSALAGIAIDHGAVASDTARVTPLLPYSSYANPDPRKNDLTIRDLLTMRSGFECDDWNAQSPGNESRVYQSDDWVKFVLDLPMTTSPGTKGSYCSGNVAVVGRLVERGTGKSLPTVAREWLFAPLGIRAADVRWNYALDASNAATFAQLYLRPRDMLKIGILFQQGGRWAGRQVISSEWVTRSTAKWSTVGDQAYGYFWWHQYVNATTPGGTERVDMVVATGNGGQKILMVPSLDMIVVLTGGNYNTSSPSNAIMARELLPPLLAARKQ